MTTPPTPLEQNPSPLKVGLALGGGGVRGLAHIGVLEVLREADISYHLIAGASMGGIVGALAAAGLTPDRMAAELSERADLAQIARLVDVSLSGKALIKGARIYNYLASLIGPDLTFADLPVPLAMVAVDLYSGRPVVLREGKVVDAVRATISVPGVFEPVDWGPLRLVDGGVLDNVPVDVARGMGADFVIAVDVMPSFRYNVPGEAPRVVGMRQPRRLRNFQELVDVVTIMMSELTDLRLKDTPPDVLIEPELSPDIGLFFGFDRWEEVVEAGRRAARWALPRLRAALEGAMLRRRYAELNLSAADL
ncbi:MAG: patatin-like phospholipase family protein [Anaerolineae bacterium]|nr:patatin-like phospholipase family protein [Anaerolineae bacterium]